LVHGAGAWWPRCPRWLWLVFGNAFGTRRFQKDRKPAAMRQTLSQQPLIVAHLGENAIRTPTGMPALEQQRGLPDF
jgi:hypothetical protein